jgi:hypothetical protein
MELTILTVLTVVFLAADALYDRAPSWPWGLCLLLLVLLS